MTLAASTPALVVWVTAVASMVGCPGSSDEGVVLRQTSDVGLDLASDTDGDLSVEEAWRSPDAPPADTAVGPHVDGGPLDGDAAEGPCRSSFQCDERLGPLPECKLALCQVDGTCGIVDRPDLTPCDDGEACTTGDRCESGSCGGGFNTCACSDDSDCLGGDDGNLCNGVPTCQNGTCAWAPETVVVCPTGDDCSVIACQPTTGACISAPKLDGTSCDDGSVCTTEDRCMAGQCQGGMPLDCGSAPDCQVYTCDATTGCALENVDDVSCDDGDACTLSDVCAGGSCSGQTVDCVASGPCFVASCDPVAGCSETLAPSGAACDDGDACTLSDVCVGALCQGENICPCDTPDDCPLPSDDACVAYTCSGGQCELMAPPACPANPNPCVVAQCLPASGQCGLVELPNGVSCDAGTCSGPGQCLDGACQAVPLTCDDANPCTADTCDDATGCLHAANAGLACEDGEPCTTDDACDAAGDCAPGVTTACNDDDLCTSDTCIAGQGCQFVKDGACDDGDPCTTDFCTPAAGCQNAPTLCFGPGEGCSIPGCVPDTGECGLVAAADGTLCPDDDDCTEDETCLDGVCQVTPLDCDDMDPCTTDSCASVGGCQHTPVPRCS